MKKVAIAVFSVALLVAGSFFLVKLFQGYTQKLMETPRKFFQTASEGKFAETYAYATKELQSTLSQEQLQSFLMSNGFTNYISADCNSFNVKNNLAELQISVNMKQGGSIPTKIGMKYEEDSWKIFLIERLNLPKLNGNISIPDSKRQLAMVKESMHDFALAANSKDFSALHQKCHENFRNKFTPEQLFEIFADTIATDFDLLTLKDLTPTITESRLEQDQALVLTGHYTKEEKTVHFRFRYYSAEWKLLGITVTVR